MVSKSKGRIVINGERCKGCGLCIWACPKDHIRLTEQEDHRGIHIACFNEAHACTGCAFCAIICPDVAIEVYRGRRKRFEVRGGRQNVKVQS